MITEHTRTPSAHEPRIAVALLASTLPARERYADGLASERRSPTATSERRGTA